jgi:N-acetylneuraminic acid mutarotase
LFGGYGYDSTGALGYLNDLWQFSPSTGLWTWISGADAANAAGVYGEEGSGSSGTVPGARQGASSWIDSSGNLWLFGGGGYDAAGGIGDLSDLWRFSPSTRLWTWVAGTNANNTAGSYGTQGTVSGGSSPGARQAASAWIGTSGRLWLFGGIGYGLSNNGYLNDLWQFLPP